MKDEISNSRNDIRARMNNNTSANPNSDSDTELQVIIPQ